MPQQLTDEAYASVLIHLGRLGRVIAERKQLKRSFEIADANLKSSEAVERAALLALHKRYGTVRTVRGRIGAPTGFTVSKDEAVLLAWARDFRDGVIKETVSVTALEESGCVWKEGRMIDPSGEAIPGITRARSEGVSITDVAGIDDEDDWS